MVALAFIKQEELLWETFKWVGLIFGSLLGIFLLGVLTKNRGHDRINVAAMLSSLAILVTLKLVQERNGTVYVAWPWWIVIGTVWTFGIGACSRTRKPAA